MQSEKLKLLGFSSSIRGALYMDSVLRIIGHAKTVRMMDLYADAAKEFKTHPENISSGIRYAIKKWWRIAPDDVKKKHFRMNYNLGQPPTNKAFFSYIVSENVNAFKED